MNTNQYLGHATRGLWGQKKRDAQTELRGAIEDKIWRHTLRGLSPEQAEQAALRDLGSPHLVARDLNRVHTAPTTLRATLLLGVAGLLSLQAAAQIGAVGSTFLAQDLEQCRVLTPQDLARMKPGLQARVQRLQAFYGGPERLNAECLSGAFNPNGPLLSVTDLLAALKAARVPVSDDTSATTVLTLNGGVTGAIAQASFQTETVDGHRYLPSLFLMPFLKSVTAQPFSLTGLTNPVLTIGTARIPIGSARAPVATVDVLGHGLADARRTETDLPLPLGVQPMPSRQAFDPAAPQLVVPGRDGELFAVVQNVLRVNEDRRGADAPETLWVRARHNSRIQFTDEVRMNVRVVNSQAELDQATARGVKAAVVYRVNAANLQRPVLTPIPAAQVQVVPPRE